MQLDPFSEIYVVVFEDTKKRECRTNHSEKESLSIHRYKFHSNLPRNFKRKEEKDISEERMKCMAKRLRKRIQTQREREREKLIIHARNKSVSVRHVGRTIRDELKDKFKESNE